MTIQEIVTYLYLNSYRAGHPIDAANASAALAEAANNFNALRDEATLRDLNGAWARATRFYEALNPPTAVESDPVLA